MFIYFTDKQPNIQEVKFSSEVKCDIEELLSTSSHSANIIYDHTSNNGFGELTYIYRVPNVNIQQISDYDFNVFRMHPMYDGVRDEIQPGEESIIEGGM